jgi:hypothetical protein
VFHHATMSPLAQSFIVSSMNSKNGYRAWAWPVCALLFWLTADPPHCDLCDRVAFAVASAHQPTVKHSHPFSSDTCNGICPCCGFYGLPNFGRVLVPLKLALAEVVPELPHPAFVPLSTIFRPPRTSAS